MEGIEGAVSGDLIHMYFGYLFDEYGFRTQSERHFESFGNWVYVFESASCRIRFFKDRFDVFVELGPLWSPPSWNVGPWIGLKVVLTLLVPDADFPWPSAMSPDREQLEGMAKIFRPYCRQACELFGENSYPLNQERLEKIRDRQDDEFYGRYGLLDDEADGSGK